MKTERRRNGWAVAACAALALSAVAGGVAWAADKDARVERALDGAKLKYSMSPSNAFRVLMEYEDKRTQLVLVNSSTEKEDEAEMRQVYSRAFDTNGPLSAAQANELLRDNDTQTLGSWQVVLQDGKSLVFFGARIPADASPALLRASIDKIGQVADEMELKVTKKDDF